jgi:acyl carrier protein
MRPDTLERVRRIIASYLNLPADEIVPETRLQDIGVDSLGALELVFRMEEEFGVSVPDERIPEFTTVQAVCDGIEALGTLTSSR